MTIHADDPTRQPVTDAAADDVAQQLAAFRDDFQRGCDGICAQVDSYLLRSADRDQRGTHDADALHLRWADAT